MFFLLLYSYDVTLCAAHNYAQPQLQCSFSIAFRFVLVNPTTIINGGTSGSFGRLINLLFTINNLARIKFINNLFGNYK